MPSIDELQRLLFQDFGMETSRRTPLTLLGEHYYGAEQGRIVTERVSALDSSGTSVASEATGTGDDDEDEVICAEDEVHAISVQASMSGTLQGGSECEPADEDFAIDAETETMACSGCLQECTTEPVQMNFTCPGTCIQPDDPENTFQAGVTLTLDLGTGHWTAHMNVSYNGVLFCGQDFNFLGGDDIYQEDWGTDPSGLHVVDFDDPSAPGLHYTFTINVTL